MAETARRRTLLIIADSANGGLALSAQAEAEWFSARGWCVTISAPEAITAATSVPFRRLEIPYRIRELRGIARAARHARSLIRELDPSVVHAHGTRSLLVARLAGARAYLTLHGLPAGGSRLAAAIRRAVVQTAGALARKSYSVTPELNGGRWLFTPHASPRLAALEQFDLPPAKRPVFLWLGDLRKRPEIFVEALAEAARVTPMQGLIVGGSDAEIASLEALAQQLNAPVEMRPFTEDVAPLLASSSAVVLISESEGVPFVLEEAMWCGRAVIATDLPGTRWLLGGTGRLVQSKSELVEALITLSDGPTARRCGLECATQVRRLLTTDSPWPAIEQEFVRGLT